LQESARAPYHRSKPHQPNEEDKRVADTHGPSPAEPETNREEKDGGGDDSLQRLSREQRDYARDALSRELGREPADEEIDDWLRRQTEGY
jgi:hypothetical protein